MKIAFATKEDSEQLNGIYDAAFESNPCPENMIEEETDDGEPDLTPEVAMQCPGKTVLCFSEGNALIGGAILDLGNPAVHLLERLFIAPAYQRRGYGFRAWQEIERTYTNGATWRLRTPTYLVGNACFYINRCGFAITGVEDVGSDGIGMFVFTKPACDRTAGRRDASDAAPETGDKSAPANRA